VTALRLDEALVARGYFQSRSRARDAVLRETVFVNGAIAKKPSQTIRTGDELQVADAAQNYVSRAALKLIHALDYFGFDVRDKAALDIGASTGGFSQVLLERGACSVTAVDVGHGQIAEQLRSDPRVTLYEGLNARDLTAEHIETRIEMIVCDVSFISLRLALPAALELVNQGTQLLALIKPQFEVGRENVGKGGLVTDPIEHARVCEDIAAFLREKSWKVLGVIVSPVEGGDGNREFLIAAEKSK
jgi:23S rRNA (cytidine1920-2'-O)/16S rRNA (cytidine1409-2'-O)-methyltransferase